jgi:PAS domain S-box-containing protein
MMIVGTAVPWIINIVYLFFFNSTLPIDPTPFALVISGIFYTWGLFRLGLFNLLPMAAETVIEGIQDGVMVTDQTGLVVYINLAFSEHTGISSHEAIGSTAKKVLARWPELVGEFDDQSSASAQIAIQLTGDKTRHFEMRISPLYDRRHRFGGRVFILREIAGPAGIRAVDLTSATGRIKLMLLTTKANGEIMAANDRFAGVLGYTRAELMEQPSISIWESIEQRTLLLRLCHSEGLENMETSLVSKNSEKIRLIASAKAITVNAETYLFFAMRENR